MRSANDQLDTLGFSQSFGKAIKILVVPMVQLVFLRYFLHSTLGLHFGFRDITDYDFLLPAPIAFFVLIYLLDKGELLILRLQKKYLILSTIFFLAFVLLNIHFDQVAYLSPVLFASSWFFCLFAMLVTSLCLWVSPRYFYKNPNRFAFLPCVLIACSVALHTRFIKAPWGPFATHLSLSLRPFINFVLGESVVTSITEEKILTIQHPLLLLRIGKGCGGMESFFYFSFLFGLFATFKRAMATTLQWVIGFCVGLILMYFANLLRILLLFQIGVWLISNFGIVLGREMLIFLFHANLGWILYSIVIASYFSFLIYAFNPLRAFQWQKSAAHY